MLTVLPILGLVMMFIVTICASCVPSLMTRYACGYKTLGDNEKKLVLIFSLVAIFCWLVTGYSLYEYIQHNPCS